jgi:hypothetical protein
MHWVTITGLLRHWEDSRVDADVDGDTRIIVKTKNISGLHLSSPWKDGPMRAIQVVIDGKAIDVAPAAIGSGGANFTQRDGVWQAVAKGTTPPPSLQKQHGLQGPIDDAFMAPFLVVTPSGKCASPQVQKWVDFELAHQQDRWQAVFRGELRVKADTEVTDEDIRQFHLILWGDAQANRLVARLVDKLPIQWDKQTLSVNGQKFDAATHVPVLVYPNPLNPTKYVVLNSGPTFREDDDRTNSLQNPKLPDWAILDVTSAPTGRSAGKVAAAGFFDEQWKFRAEK